MKKLFLSVIAIALFSTPVLACKADEAHNRKYHGDPQCLQCSCLHHHDDHSDDVNLQPQTLVSLEDDLILLPVQSPSNETLGEQVRVSE